MAMRRRRTSLDCAFDFHASPVHHLAAFLIQGRTWRNRAKHGRRFDAVGSRPNGLAAQTHMGDAHSPGSNGEGNPFLTPPAISHSLSKIRNLQKCGHGIAAVQEILDNYKMVFDERSSGAGGGQTLDTRVARPVRCLAPGRVGGVRRGPVLRVVVQGLSPRGDRGSDQH